MAHPTRLRLLGLLRMGGAQTGVMLAGQVDEAAGTVSYHLKTLEAAGLVVKAEPQSEDRRAQWWAAAHDRTTWDDGQLAFDPETAEASQQLNHVVGQIYAQQWSAYVDSIPTIGREWVDAAHSSDSGLRLTPAQLAELSAELDAVAERWQTLSAAQSDAAAEPVTLITQAYRRAR